MAFRSNRNYSNRNLIDALEPRRLLSGGQIDTTFGTGGSAAVEQTLPQFSERTQLFQQDGKLLLGGSDTANGVVAAVVRLNSDGSIDRSFGKNGEATFVFDSSSKNSGIGQMAMQPDGRIVIAGGESVGLSGNLAGLARLNTDGSLDTTFNHTGTETYGTETTERWFNIVKVMADGRILVGGQSFPGTDFLIARFKGDGTPDTSLHGTGYRWIDMGGEDDVEDLNVTSNGEIIATGYMEDFAKSVTVELTSSGAVDDSFGVNGRRYDSDFMPINGGTFMESDGSFIVVGMDTKTDTAELREYSANGEAAGVGSLALPTLIDTRSFLSAAEQPNGKIIVAGMTGDSSTGAYTGIAAIRVNKDCTIDTTFGDNGSVSLGGANDSPAGISIAPDGGVVIGIHQGQTEASVVYKFTGNSTWTTTPITTGEGVSLATSGVLTITGTTSNDNITVKSIDGNIVVDRNGVQSFFAAPSVNALIINALDGDDTITNSTAIASTIDGGAGNDILSGGSGKDVLHGDAGNDTILGNAGNDTITGDDGKDSLRGGDGDDSIDGGSSNDRIYGDQGHDMLIGGNGDDRFYAQEGVGDTLMGGAGTDYAYFDGADKLSSIAFQM